MLGFKKINLAQSLLVSDRQPCADAHEDINNNEDTSHYFESAKDWAYERYEMQSVMANRWQLAFWVTMGFSILLLVMLMMLFPLKSWEPIIVQKNTQTGEVFVDDIHNHYLPETSSEVQSDLVR